MTKLKLVLILIGGLLYLLPKCAIAQKKTETDSLIAVLANPKITGNKHIDALNKLGYLFAKADSAKAYKYTSQALLLAEKNNYTIGIADAQRHIGIIQTYKNHLQSALSAFNTAIQQYNKIKKDKDVGLVYNDIGVLYIRVQTDIELALSNFFKAEVIHRKGNNIDELLADLNAIGVAYNQNNDKRKAIQYYLDAAAIADITHRPGIVPQLYINIGQMLFNDKNFNGAKGYYLKAIDLLRVSHEDIDLGIAYLNIANVFTEQSDYRQADIELNNALRVFIKNNFTRGMQVCYNNMGAVALRQGRYNDAVPILEKSIKISEDTKNYIGLSLTRQNIAYAYTKLGQLTKAAELFDAAENEAVKFKNNASVFGEIYNHRSMLDSAMGNYRQAFINRNKYLQIKDSLLNEKLSKQINELQTKYETEKKQKQIEALNHKTAIQTLNLKNQGLQLQQNKSEIKQKKLLVDNQKLQIDSKQDQLNKSQLEDLAKGQKIRLLNNKNTIQQLEISKRNTTIMIIATLFLLALIMGYQFYSRYKLRQAAVLQAEVIKQQDIATKGIIEAEERERKRIAAELHDGVGQLFTTVKMNMEILMERFLLKQPDADILAEKTMAMVDESCIEVRSIAHQMMPNALIKSGLVSALRDFINKIPSEKLKISLETKGIDKGLESTTETVLYRVIQESVNNVIKHAEATALDILILCDDKEITVSIEDNGKGFNSNDKSKFNGIGLKNMTSRVEFLKGTVDISSSPGKGTLVAIFIPIA